METYRAGFLSFLYCCYCSNLIFCSDDYRRPNQQNLSTLKIGQIMNFNNSSKHLYHVLTKIDRFLRPEQPDIKTLRNFEEFYNKLTDAFENRRFTDGKIFDLSRAPELTDVLNRTFGGMFYKSRHQEYQEFAVSCCLYYDENSGGNFVNLEPENWDENSNEKRRSIGVRELLSTILYNNGIPIDKLGNLTIGDEGLKKRYYDHKQV
jgi:hypothetical protein